FGEPVCRLCPARKHRRQGEAGDLQRRQDESVHRRDAAILQRCRLPAFRGAGKGAAEVTTPMIRLRARDGHELDAYLARPAAGPRGAVVIAQEMYGVNAYL